MNINKYKTPYKYGRPVFSGSGEEGTYNKNAVDGSFIFFHNSKYYMMHIGFDGKGYQTAISKSDDLLNWSRGKLIFERGELKGWDKTGIAGGWILRDNNLFGKPKLKKYKGKYWMLYGSYPKEGYEEGSAQLGLAYTEDENLENWTRLKKPILTWKGGADWEKGGLYKGCLVEHEGMFYLFYNAKNKEYGNWKEQIGMAVSDDLINWKRNKSNPIISNTPGSWDRKFAANPFVVKDGDIWIMFYYGYDDKHAADGIAYSKDLLNWTKYEKPILTAGEKGDIDYYHAHKPCVISKDGILYHFYCAVRECRKEDIAKNKIGKTYWEHRVITVATNKEIK